MRRGQRRNDGQGTEKVIRAIYDDIKKQQADLDWFWVKQEAEAIMAGSPQRHHRCMHLGSAKESRQD